MTVSPGAGHLAAPCGKLDCVKREEVAWVFDALPPSGARRGGDPASHVFDANLRAFVREVVQNAADQASPEGAPQVHFRFHDLQGRELDQFLEAISWSTLRPHLDSAAQTRGGRAIKQALDDIDKRKRLLLLVIEDRETVGLTGNELDGESHFRALCKDTLFSHKQSEGSGGSYGLGKSVLWGFSGLSTVVFNSKLSTDPSEYESPRLIGRTELPTHTIAARPPHSYAGSGWFGRKVGKAEVHAESIWSEHAAELAEQLRLGRTDPESSGTSILVVGFRDPTSEGERSVADLAREIHNAIEREFWPATVMPHRPLVTWVATGAAGKMVAAKDFTLAAPFVECYRQRNSRADVLSEPGDVVVREIEIEVPARRDGSAKAMRGHVRLCVRLCGDHEQLQLPGHVAMFRGPGMVVRYVDRRSLAVAARPFHAVVACGNARSPENPLASDIAIERFLRAAEPPGHDKWEATATLKAEYERGYAKAIDQMTKRVDEALKSLVVEHPRQGQRGPDRLRRRFPLGQKGGGGGSPSAFRFSGINAQFEHGCWSFRGEVRPATTVPSWACEVRLAEIGEDGGDVGAVDIASLKLAGSGTVEIVGGRAVIRTTIPSMMFEGMSVRGSSGRRALTLEIRSRTEVARAE